MTTVATKTRSIIFTGAMVPAILAGRKSQTRRLIKNPDYYGCLTGDCLHDYQRECDASMLACSPFSIGQEFWVRESFAIKSWTDHECAKVGCPDAKTHPTEKYLGEWLRAIYKASYTWPQSPGRWVSPIHMPRWASRLTIRVKAVRVQRVQEITEADAAAEGVFHLIRADDSVAALACYRAVGQKDARGKQRAVTGRDYFAVAWDRINPNHRWQSNPWVRAVTFERVL